MTLMRRAWNCGEFYPDFLKLSKVQLVQFGVQSPDESHSYITFLSDHDFLQEPSEFPAIVVGFKKTSKHFLTDPVGDAKSQHALGMVVTLTVVGFISLHFPSRRQAAVSSSLK